MLQWFHSHVVQYINEKLKRSLVFYIFQISSYMEID